MTPPMTLPTVVIPGLACTPRLFTEQIPVLWQFGPVVVADHTRAESFAELATQILAAAPPRFGLLGLSMGGYLSFEILRRQPDRVARLALLDTSGRPDRAEQSDRRRAQMTLAGQGRFEEVIEQLMPLMLHPDHLADEQRVDVVRQMNREAGADAFIRQQTALIARPDSRPDLAGISCPTLVLVGAEDILTPPELSTELAAGIAGSRLVVVLGAGHLSTLDQPDEVNRALVDWCRSTVEI